VSESLQPQDLVITLLGTYAHPREHLVWSGGLVALLGQLGFSDGAARVALTRLVRRGLLGRERTGRLVHYRLTPRCKRLLDEGDRRIFTFGEPRDESDSWTVVWHQIPEDRRLERSRLARRLRFLGFGSVQDSVWVSPHNHSEDVSTLVADLDVVPFATVFAARPGAAAGLPALVARAWDLSGLLERYEAFDAEFSPLRRRGVELTDAEAFSVRTRLVHQFRGFPQLDPELPEELTPVSRARARSVRTFQVLYRALAPRSQRHFDAMTGAGPR
jgi:phenylacetic acid degradation operon negative regulatory protein